MLDRQAQARRRYVDYYIFSVNGQPVTDRLVVRRKLTYPWVKHCYFAKIQFGPATAIGDFEDADRAAQEFVSYLLPRALEALPTSQDVQRLEDAARQG